MVFESLVADILNKFLGDYVENLDRSQLKIGIWGGDVSLKNLSLKPTALDDLNLPVKTVYGHLGKLILKIPWKNIYTAPVEVHVEDLFLLVNPIQDIVYDAGKEEKLKQDAKQALISKVELAKKTEKEKEGAKVDDTFVEKLAAQIVKNVQIFIENIHVRYEDRVTKPGHPFSIGLSLHTLKVFTSNESCDRYILPQETSPIFYKVMVMEGLSLYWNINPKLFTGHEEEQKVIMDLFIDGIPSKNHFALDYQYILGPINSEAKLQINSKPEMINFITPKIFLSLVLEQLLVHINRSQYQDFISLLETFDRMSRAAPYRKYRPDLKSFRGHYREWWKFAITCVLEEEVKRKFNNWNWNIILSHRKLIQRYQIIYRATLTEKPTEAMKAELASLERDLDAFNIILMRQKVENEVEREGRRIAEQKAKKGWFGGWFSSSKNQDESADGGDGDLVKKFENVMTDEEKKKLYRAIDYHEGASPTSYPQSYIAIRTEFILHVLRIVITDDYSPVGKEDALDNRSVLCIEFKDAFVALHQRPSAQSFAVTVKMKSFQTLGLSQNGVVPQIVKSKLKTFKDDSAVFLDVYFETNPDENCDQKLHITLRPLKVVYDAQTFIKILEVFTPERDISTVKNQLQAAANTKLEEMKEKSSIRLQYAIETSSKLDLKIDLMAPYLILPYGGFYTKNEVALVINLGRITIESINNESTPRNIKRMLSDGHTEDQVLNQLLSQCYDHFAICLGDIQMLSLEAGQNWQPKFDRVSESNPYYDAHILHPTSIYIDIYKSLIDDDPRLPKIKIVGNLPDVTIRITEKKLLEIVSLVLSLPLPSAASTTSPNPQPVAKEDSSMSLYDSTTAFRQKLQSVNKLQFSTLKKIQRPNDKNDDDDLDGGESLLVDLVNLEAVFKLKALTVYVMSEGTEAPFLESCITGLELTFVQRTYSCEIFSKLGMISLTQNWNNSIIPAVSTPAALTNEEQYLFCCKLLIAEKSAPVFEKMYNSTAISLELDFTKLYIVAHQEAILNTIQWINTVQNNILRLVCDHRPNLTVTEPKLETVKRRKNSSSSNASTCDVRRKKLKTKSALTAIVEDQLSDISSSSETKRKAEFDSEVTELKVTARLNVIQMCLQTSSRPVATMDVDGFNASVLLKKSTTQIDAVLQSISVCDLNPETMYNKVAYILEGKDALRVQILLLNTERKSDKENDFDMFVKVQMSCLQCVFINEFVMRVLEFMNNFQTSKQMIADASAAAMASAKMNVQQMYQSSTRISLDIFADAPVIIVPRNNRSNEIFIVDFGNFSVKNSLKFLNGYKTGTHIPLIDDICTNLNDMKIVRTNYERTIPESLLLKPVNYTLIIKRNLSASWFTEAPDFDIDGAFCPIYMSVTDEDYKLIMKTLNENIAAISSPKSSKTVSTATENDMSNKPETVEVECHGVAADDDIDIEDETIEEGKARNIMRFAMAIESVTLDIFSGLKENGELDGLAKFTLSFLCVKGSVLSNGNMSVKAFLSDCCLDDTRASKQLNEVKRYMQRKASEEGFSTWSSFSSEKDAEVSLAHELPAGSMIGVTFEKEASQTQIYARVFSFLLILNMDHLMKIQEFFLSELTSGDGNGNSNEALRKQATISNVESLKIQAGEPVTSVTSCSIIIEKPDIILVENLDDINTNAIILNNEANLKILLCSDGRLSLNGTLKNLQLFSCCYNPTKRNQTASLILYPFTVDLTGSTADDKSLHLNVQATELMVSVTAGTIELLTKILSTLVPNAEPKTDANEVSLKDYSNVWQQNSISDDYWFLKSEEGIDIASTLHTNITESNAVDLNKKDVFMVGVPVIGISLEAGVGKKTLPLLAIRSSFQGIVNRTVNSITVESSITLEIGYYNSRIALWEPIIEPVLRSRPVFSITPKYVPWQLQMNIRMVNKNVDTFEQENALLSNDTFDSGSVLSIENETALPALALSISSQERMEVTFTKTCLDVVRTLTQSFNNAVSLKACSTLAAVNEIGFSCYKLVNDFGVDVVLSLHANQPFRIAKTDPTESFTSISCETVPVQTGETVNLLMRKDTKEDAKFGKSNELCLLDKLNMTTDKQQFFLCISVPEKNKDLKLPVSKADKRYFSLKTQTVGTSTAAIADPWGLVSEVEIADGNFITTLRSVVRVYNHFNVKIHVYYMKNGKNKTELSETGVVEPMEHLNVPVQAVYSSKCQLYFAPERFSPSNEPFVWKDLQKTVSLTQQLQCQSKNPENEDPFFIRILGQMEQIYYEDTPSYTIASTIYNIHLRPTLILKNFLPVDVVCCLQGTAMEHILKPAERINVSSAEPNHSTIVLRLDNYLDKVWSCKKIIKSDAPVFSVWTFDSYDSEKQFSLNLGVWYCCYDDSMVFTLYCPFWMVNKTGLNLSYRGVEDGGMILHHPQDFDKPILFSFKEKSFFSKKKACVRINDGDWSDKFSVDAAGSSGSVMCHYKKETFQLGVYIRLNYNSLTKQVIFSPFYTIANNCPFPIEFRENQVQNSAWTVIQSEACVPLWPSATEDKRKTLELRICGTIEITSSFSYLKIRTYSLMLLNKYGGLHVDVQVNEGGVYIAVSMFQPKMATALIINDTTFAVDFGEVDRSASVRKSSDTLVRHSNNCYRKWRLESKKEILFNWSSSFSEKPVLSINRSSELIDLRKDGIGEFSVDQGDEKMYWISFLHGMQRILLVTSDDYTIRRIEAVGDFVAIQKEILISIEGIGFSLVNNISKQELLYISVSSSGVVWEKQEKAGKRFKPVKPVVHEKLEEAYTNYCDMLAESNGSLNINQEIEVDNDSKITVNFHKWLVIQPISAKLRRTYNSGLWLQIKSSEHYKQIHSKVHRLQMDNQIYDCVFPVIFFPVPPPKSVAIEENSSAGLEKPFVELSIVQRINENSAVNQFKYFKVLIQEFHVKADIGFINGLVKFFEADCITDEEEIAQFETDEKVVREPLCLHVSSVTSQDFYDLLHFSPLKIHVSFSLSGENPNDGTPQQGLPIVNLLTQSVGVTLTDVNDVVFRLAYFERKHTFYSQAQLTMEVKNHYIGQLVKQLYVLVLGLDVLGNPFGLVTGLKQGVEDFFYEPFQGAIQGPSEFAEGVFLGVRSLFGHTVGGAAGAVGRITGAMGKGIAALTLDENYQKKRRQRLAQHNQSIKEGGRGLVMGVVEGVGGVFSKPISGAREEGAKGLAKGVGKGVVGLFMRPASGVVDFASGTVDVVRRAATCAQEVRRYRLPRFIKENGLVIPFSHRDAVGYKLLLDIERGRFTKTDYYISHFPMTDSSHPNREVLLLTNNRILYLNKANDIFSDNFKIEWQYAWQEIKPDCIGETENGIVIKVNCDDRNQSSSVISSFKSIFQQPSKGKIILISDKNLKKWLLTRMKELIQKTHNS